MMNHSPPSPARPIRTVILALLPAACAIFFAISFCASLAAPILRHDTASPLSIVTALAYLVLFAVAVFLLRRIPPHRDLLAAWLIILAIGIIRFTIAFSVPINLPLNTDQGLFRKFAVTLADQGRNLDTLGALSGHSDYFVWAGRVFPIHEGIRKLCGKNDLYVMRAINVITSVLVLMLVLYAASILLPPGIRRWPVFFLAALPFQTYWVTDYTHHLYSSTYLFAFACALLALLRTRHLWSKAFFSAAMSILLLLMSWHGGIDRLALGIALGTMLAYFFLENGKRQVCLNALFGLLLPFACLHLFSGPLLINELIAGSKYHAAGSAWGFPARGWCLDNGGEYSWRLEQMESLVPPKQKDALMKAVLVREIRDTPLKDFARLPILKTGKLFLVGYANNWEESLQMAQSPALPILRGFRQMSAPAFLLVVLLGALVLIRQDLAFDRPWIVILLMPMLAWGAYVICGETSPRYSIYAQPAMALMAGAAFMPQANPLAMHHLRNLIKPISLAFLLLLLLFAAIRTGSHLIPPDTFSPIPSLAAPPQTVVSIPTAFTQQ